MTASWATFLRAKPRRGIQSGTGECGVVFRTDTARNPVVPRTEAGSRGGSVFRSPAALLDGLGDRLSRPGERRLLVRGVEVEIDPAQRPRTVILAEDHRDVFVQGDAMAK